MLLKHYLEKGLRDTANVRIHQITKERPVDRFERERVRDRIAVAPAVEVERRPLATYAPAVGGGA